MKIIKIASLLTMLLMPLASLVCADFFARGSFSAQYFALYYGIGLCIMLLIFGLEKLALASKKASRAIRGVELVFFIASLLAVMIISFSVYPNSLSGLFFTACAAFFAVLGRTLAKKPVNECVSGLWIGIFCGFSVGAFVIFSLSAHGEVLKTGRIISLGSFVLVLVLSVFLRNQSSITTELSRRRGENSELSSRVRRSNVALSLIFCVIFLTSLLSVGTLSSLASGGLKNLIKAIVGFFKVQLQGVNSEIPREFPDDFMSYANLSTADDSILVAIFSLIFIGLLGLIVFLTVRFIVNKVRGFVNNSEYKKDDSRFAYIDTFEEKAPPKKAKANIKKLLRLYRREKRPIEKFRLGYRLILLYLQKKGENVCAWSTTAVHLEAIEKRADADLAKKLVCAYNSVRYDDEKPSEASLELLDRFISELSLA